MMNFSGSKEDVVQFAADMRVYFARNSPLITITVRGASEVYYVSIATDMLSEGTARALAASYSLQLTTIS